MVGPPSPPQMHARRKRRRQAHIPRHNKRQAPRPANAGQVTAQRGAVRVGVMAKDHAGQPARQPSHG